MPTYEEKPWWELDGKPPPHEAQFEAERERLHQERVRAWRERLDERERRVPAQACLRPADHRQPEPSPRRSS